MEKVQKKLAERVQKTYGKLQCENLISSTLWLI